MAERFLVTGGQGFIGAWIARRLLDNGLPFVIAALTPDDHILRQVLEPDELDTLDRIYGDVVDGDFVRRALGESGATRVIHLAGLQVPTCRAEPLRGARVNVLGTLNVFEAARQHGDQVASIVYASSAAVAGPAEDYSDRVPDDAHHVPRTHYGVFKLANEGGARIYWQDHGVPSVGLRPLAAYGVGREIGVTSGPTLAIRAAVRGEEFAVPFTGTTGFNFGPDVAAAFVGCALRHREGAVAYNNPGENHDVRHFLDVVESVVPAAKGKLRCEGGPLPIAWDFDETGLDELLGGAPHTPIEVGIERTAQRFGELEARGG